MLKDLVYGIHAVQGMLAKEPERILELFLLEDRSNSRIQGIEKQSQEIGILLKRLSRKQLEALLPSVVHQGVIARVRLKAPLSENDLMEMLEEAENALLFLVLDGVQDPHNLGACLRTADAVAINALIIPKDRSVGLNATVRKIASGAAETIPIIEVTNLVRCLEQMKKRGIWVMGASSHASKTLYEVDLKGNIAIVLGAEATGLRRLTEACCDVLMRIPMLGSIESLNVSVAAGVCLYEAFRQRLSGTKA